MRPVYFGLAICLFSSASLATERRDHRSHQAHEHVAHHAHARDLVTEAATDNTGRDNTEAVILDDGEGE